MTESDKPAIYYEPCDELVNSGAGVLENWIWQTDPISEPTEIIYFSEMSAGKSRMIEDMRVRYGIILTDGWDGTV